MRMVMELQAIDRTQTAIAGGKGAHLGELTRLEGIRVPAGFCVTTGAFQRIMADAAPAIGDRIDRLSRLKAHDRHGIRVLSAEIRGSIEAVAVPEDVAAAITAAIDQLGQGGYAVRSSATAEDLPTASFAGQHDTYLDVAGAAAIIDQVRRCWASLFSERAVSYRLKHNIDHRIVHMAVVVQRMVAAQSSGVLFTADPVTGNRKVVCIEAAFGGGEALVSGVVRPDVYRVRDAAVVTTQSATQRPALTGAQAVRLAALGRRIEARFGRPQDIEWCLVDDDFAIVQSRPITTLFPIPAANDQKNHVYVSVGHQQMMIDAMKPLGLSFWQLTTPRPMAEAGGRLFVDVTPMLASASSRASLLRALGKSDPLIGDALETVLNRDDFIGPPVNNSPGWTPPGAGSAAIPTDPAIVHALIARSQASLADLKRDIRAQSGPALLDFIVAHIEATKQITFDPLSMQAVMAGMEAGWWLNDQLQAWLGEKNAADTLTQSVPDNVTSEMGLALLDVADVVRRHPDVVTFLQRVEDEDFLDQLPLLPGGRDVRDAIDTWLAKYGMRGVGEIDITRPRWSERPAMLVPIILGHVEHFEPGAAGRRFEQGRQDARKKEAEILERLRALPDGERKVEETRRMIDRVRTFAGYREYPKYGMVSRYFVYKQALTEEADRLVRSRVLREREDIFYLRFDELREAVRTNQVDDQLVRQRTEAFRADQMLIPPRVLTSDGEAIAGSYRRDNVPANALVGLPVSAGTVEGRARVILDMADADFEAGDILVTTYTDPSWTPLFLAVAGLVTEVGGLMTHGAVIAREYGVPALVGVEHATRRIRDGQRIRVHGTEGYVEMLP